MRNCLGVRRALKRTLTGPLPPMRGAVEIATLRVMHRHQFRMRVHLATELLDQHCAMRLCNWARVVRSNDWYAASWISACLKI